MTLDEITAEVCERLNLTSDEAKSRVTREVNNRYRSLTSSVGLQTSRMISTSATATAGSKNLTFTNVEKILAVIDKTDPKQDVVLEEITPDEMHISTLRSPNDMPRHYAVMTMDPRSVTIEMDVVPVSGILTPTVIALGSGYQVGDVVSLVGGTTTTTGTLQITGVNGNGGVTSLTIHTAGFYTALPSNPVSTTNGSGTGLTVNITWTVPFTLYADAITTVTTLSGNQSPDFPESFHDVLIWGAMADEYLKMEKTAFYQMAEQKYETRLSDLRMFIAKSAYKDIYQGRYNAREYWWSRDAQLLWDT